MVPGASRTGRLAIALTALLVAAVNCTMQLPTQAPLQVVELAAVRPTPTPTPAELPTPTPAAAPTPTPAAAAPSPPSEAPTTAPPTGPSPTATPTPAPAPRRQIVPTMPVPFATAGPLTLFHPSTMVEMIGFHQSHHEGAQDMAVLEGAIQPVVLESRDRLTGPMSAADVVVAPDTPIAAPVTGTVIRAGSYTLYCEHRDSFVVIEPDAQPGWEVKILHISDLTVSRGSRVEGGLSMIAERPTVLPFRSQVDDETAEPSWPHTHLEVVDPSIPNIPSGGGC